MSHARVAIRTFRSRKLPTEFAQLRRRGEPMALRNENMDDDAEAYLNRIFRRELLRQIGPKRKMRVLKGMAEGVKMDGAIPIRHTAEDLRLLARARELLREEMASLMEP